MLWYTFWNLCFAWSNRWMFQLKLPSLNVIHKTLNKSPYYTTIFCLLNNIYHKNDRFKLNFFYKLNLTIFVCNYGQSKEVNLYNNTIIFIILRLPTRRGIYFSPSMLKYPSIFREKLVPSLIIIFKQDKSTNNSIHKLYLVKTSIVPNLTPALQMINNFEIKTVFLKMIIEENCVFAIYIFPKLYDTL